MTEIASISLLKELAQGLPIHPARAIVVFSDRVLAKVINPHPNQRPGKPEDFAAITAFTLKFCSKYQIPVELPPSGPNVYDHMAQIIAQINGQRSRILNGVIDSEIDSLLSDYDSGVGDTFGIARLNAEEKKKIHEHIENIRALIESSDLSDRKKKRLFDKLSELTKEVDAHGTPTDRFFGFVSELGFVLGEFGQNTRPLFREVRGMIQSISRARARQENISLPPGDEPLRLPMPEDNE
jgi:hypothetical protein